MSIKLHDAVNLLSSKIVVQKVYAAQLDLEKLYSEKLVEMQKLCLKSISEKKKIAAQIIASMESQMSNFDEVRQLETNSLMGDLNALNQPTEELTRLMRECDECTEAIMTSMKRIEYLESLIPTQKMITNYDIKLSKEAALDLVE